MIFKEIFDRYYLPVKSYGFQYVEDDEIIEDFVQDAFLKVWEKRADFYFVAAIKSFLYMSVRNACLDYLRHQKVQRRNEPELILWLTEEGEEEFVLEEEVHAMVYDAIKDLSERSRRVVIMTMEGLSNPEIAKAYRGAVTTDRYGRKMPKHAHGTVNLKGASSSSKADVVTAGYTDIVYAGREYL